MTARLTGELTAAATVVLTAAISAVGVISAKDRKSVV